MYHIKLTERFAGYSTEAARGGDTTRVCVRGMSSVEDGKLHLNHLEGIPSIVLSLIPDEYKHSNISSMVVTITKDLDAKVYINELEELVYAIPKIKSIAKGQPLTRDDISGIGKVAFKNFEFPKDQAYFCILANRWDRIFAFDFSPLNEDENNVIDYEVEDYLGSCYSSVVYSDLVNIPNEDFDKLKEKGLFPFYALKYKTNTNLLAYIRNGWPLDELFDDFESDLLDSNEKWRESWLASTQISDFIKFFDIALERHSADDYVSSISIIIPKIEGVLRTDFVACNPTKQGRNQKALIEHIVEPSKNQYLWLSSFLPEHFQSYITECFFKDFAHSTLDNDISRHSISHGASASEQYDRKSSLISLLIFVQVIEYALRSSNKQLHRD